MATSARSYSVKGVTAPLDQSSTTLASSISAVTLTIPLATGGGQKFPQPYNGTATSLGTSTTLNSNGISAAIGGSAQQGNWIWNATDGSWAIIKTVSTNSITTTALLGGTTNVWNNGDAWRIDAFPVSFITQSTSTSGVVTDVTIEEALVIARSTDTLTIASGGRGFNGTTASTFNSGDAVQLRVTTPIHEGLRALISEIHKQNDTNTTGIATIISNLASTSNSLGASLVGIEDAGGSYTGTTVETALTEIAASLATKVALSNIGFFGDGSDGAPSWTSGASLDPTTEKNYTTATLPISQTVTVSSVNTPLIIHNTGSVTINGTLNLTGKGGAGGAQVAANNRGLIGTKGNSVLTAAVYPQAQFTTNPGTAPGAVAAGTAASGGGGASMLNAGTGGANGGSTAGGGGAAMTGMGMGFLSTILRSVFCGAGGSSGNAGQTSGGTGGAGGNGGGAMVWFIGGNLTLGSASVLACNGTDGSAGGAGGGNPGGAGGGGGGGGQIIICVAGTITNNGVTLTCGATNGGSGGSGTPAGSGSGVGQGAAGNILIYSLSKGTILTA